MSYRQVTLVAALVAAFTTFAAAPALAQDKPAATSLAPAGQGPGVNASSPNTSGRSIANRRSVKAATRSAERNGQLRAAGEAPSPEGSANPAGDKTMAPTGSTKNRAAVKAATKAAASSGSLQPAGEAPRPYTEPPKK